MANQVVVYAMQGCPPCGMVKQFLTQLGVPFEVKDVTQDPVARQEFMRMGFRGTPVTIVDGEPIVGFDQARLSAALRSHRVQTRPPVEIIW